MATLSLGQVLQKAVQAFNAGDDARARRACELILAAQPQNFEAHYVLGLVAQRCADHRLAVDHLQSATRVDPSRAEAHFSLGAVLAELGHVHEAIGSYELAIRINSDMSHAHFNRAALMAQLGRHQEAVHGYERAISLAPQDESAHFNLGVAWVELRQFASALNAFDRAISLDPLYARAHAARGMALWGMGQLMAALASLDHSIRLDPLAASSWSQRATVLLDLDRPEEALESCERALVLSPVTVDAHYNRGNSQRALHRFCEAIESFKRALALDPSHRDAHINLADCLLALGQFERGWVEYSWRWSRVDATTVDEAANGQLWSGDLAELPGRTIVLESELGLGDTLQFCRYTSLLVELGARPILRVQASLVPLLQQMPDSPCVVASGQALPQADLSCPLMRLPQVLAAGSTAWFWKGPYLKAPADQAAAIRGRLAGSRRPRVGLLWRGSESLLNDKRSMALETMLPLLDRHPEVQWFSLQKDLHPDDLHTLTSRHDITWLRDMCADWPGTAALVDAMDLVISVDTSIAHLAGGMGKPVWILLPYTPQDWRWFLEREDCPWYPSARLFRQKRPRQWAELVTCVADALVSEALVASG